MRPPTASRSGRVVLAQAAPTTKINLNTATEDAFKTIPGVGDRMAHEFDEYRPYVSITQFRREMGKYVDADVIAGYERYVFVPIDIDASDAATMAQLPGVSDEEAQMLTESRPFETREVFLDALESMTTDEEHAQAAAYLGDSLTPADAPPAAERYRRFLLGAAAFVFAVTAVEMVLIGHFEGWRQWIPTVASVLGVVAVGLIRFRPDASMGAARVLLALIAVSSLVGSYQHLAANLELELEVRPGLGVGDVWLDALQGGVPVLASGILFLAAALAWGATLWRAEPASG